MYYIVCLSILHHVFLRAEYLFLFSSLVLSTTSLAVRPLLRQLPRVGSRAEDPWTRRDTVFSINCFAVGFSFLPPQGRCFPKNDSTGSWQNFSLRRYCTPGTPRRTLDNSINECTRGINNTLHCVTEKACYSLYSSYTLYH